ncbi:SH3 domain-containing protein [Paenibacillus taihuensis]|uniref:SH3 domain-containing protein n=1 Tax=Paenibacillus taihuensis TaxID=1156355 RepID=A0A3D9RP57_9BACL|nr:glucosaminidase domain-containing protein [Paenibacillus taihuensis]REE81248.1 SH3 domain-containing protein [Paenibacillus taihuensis]
MSRSIQWNVVAYMIIAALLASFVVSFNHSFNPWSSRSADMILPSKYSSSKQVLFNRASASTVIYPKSAFQPATVVNKAMPITAAAVPVSASATVTEKKKPVTIASVKPLYTYKVTAFYLNVREEPNAESKILYEVKQGTQLQVLSKDDTGWLVLKGGGYVHGGYATVIGVQQAASQTAVSAVSSAVAGVKAMQSNSLQIDVRPRIHTAPVKKKEVKIQSALAADAVAASSTASSASASASSGLSNDDDNGNPVKPSSSINRDSGLSSAQIAQLLKGTKLAGQGLEKAILDIEEKYGINAFFTIAVMKLESGNGKSKLARTKNNLFGLNATSGSPYRRAFTFATKGDCVQKFGQLLSDNYVERGYTTVEKVARKYCPVNSKWASHVRTIMRSDFGKLV